MRSCESDGCLTAERASVKALAFCVGQQRLENLLSQNDRACPCPQAIGLGHDKTAIANNATDKIIRAVQKIFLIRTEIIRILLPSQRLWLNQTSWIYRFQATAFCWILCNAIVQDKPIRRRPNLSATTAAYGIWAVTSLFTSIYDYAGAHNAVNPALYNRSWPTNLFLSRQNPLFKNLESLQEEFIPKLPTAFGTILKSFICLILGFKVIVCFSYAVGPNAINLLFRSTAPVLLAEI